MGLDFATADQIVEAATAVIQTRGYNGFSYADIADAVGIRKASVHHHFPGKSDLGQEVARRYRERFAEALSDLESKTDDDAARLEWYADLYARELSQHGRMCLCGMLAAEYATLPAGVQDEVRGFFDDQREWLARTFGGELRPAAEARRLADAFLAGLEGALLVCRTDGSTARFGGIARVLIDGLIGASARGGRSESRRRSVRSDRA
ncbi:MAG TPA: TetR/AcrR family transcriptional regulator [Solirubrobacteraceae bacterium]|jgi:TetR/AcrR family transcriptional repressor of nem operon